MIGFMGCYAAINALKSARHIVRSEPDAKVLLLSLELCSLHMQETRIWSSCSLFWSLPMAAPPIWSAREPLGLAIDSFLAVNLSGTSQLITWRIGEQGFDMHLSGQVPGELRQRPCGSAAAKSRAAAIRRQSICGRCIPAAAPFSTPSSKGLALPADALSSTRATFWRNYGNMSSATVMFVLRAVDAARPLRANRAAPCRSGPASPRRPCSSMPSDTLDFRHRAQLTELHG